MLTYTPTPRGRAHVVIPALLITAAAVLFISSSVGLKPALPLQLLAVALMTAAIQLIARYALTTITYTLTECDDNPPDSLIITRQRGKVLTREYIPTAHITAVLSPESPIPDEIKARHNFCISMIGAKPYAILFTDPISDSTSAAFFECTPEFAARIGERILPITPSL